MWDVYWLASDKEVCQVAEENQASHPGSMSVAIIGPPRWINRVKVVNRQTRRNEGVPASDTSVENADVRRIPLFRCDRSPLQKLRSP